MKRIFSYFLVFVLGMVAVPSSVCNAETTSSTTITGKLVGTYPSEQTEQVSVTVPVSLNFFINDKSIDSIIAEDITINNNSNSAVSVTISEFYQTPGTAEYKVVDSPGSVSWVRLRHNELKMALGLVRVTNSGWVPDSSTTSLEVVPFYSTTAGNTADGLNSSALWANSQQKTINAFAGVLSPCSMQGYPTSAKVKLVTRHGLSFTEEEKDYRFGTFVIKWNVSVYRG